MPKITAERKFTGCWTCRRRNVRCGQQRPGCQQCHRLSIPCEGYEIRLVWVDSETNSYPPRSRRQTECHLTWNGVRTWTPNELDHLLDVPENCDCATHRRPSPFITLRFHDNQTDGRPSPILPSTASPSNDDRRTQCWTPPSGSLVLSAPDTRSVASISPPLEDVDATSIPDGFTINALSASGKVRRSGVCHGSTPSNDFYVSPLGHDFNASRVEEETDSCADLPDPTPIQSNVGHDYDLAELIEDDNYCAWSQAVAFPSTGQLRGAASWDKISCRTTNVPYDDVDEVDPSCTAPSSSIYIGASDNTLNVADLTPHSPSGHLQTPSLNPANGNCTWMPDWSAEDRYLFFHFIGHVSQKMIPIDDLHNPWTSTYPLFAVVEERSSTRFLCHALLSHSAFHLSSVKGELQGAADQVRAIRHYGMAIKELRASLNTEVKADTDYTAIMAALVTMIVIESLPSGRFRDWRSHLRGAAGILSLYMVDQPWLRSRDAWNVTQSIVLSMIIARTGGGQKMAAQDHTDIQLVLDNVMSGSRFGFTVAGNARLFRAIDKITMMGSQMSDAAKQKNSMLWCETRYLAAAEIIKDLQDSLEKDADAYIRDREACGQKVTPSARAAVHLHLRLLNRAVMIYLHRMVLHSTPAAITDYVTEVLQDAIVLLNVHHVESFIWPVFVASVEAHTPATQSLAVQFFDASKANSSGIREEMRAVVTQVWADRKRLARERGCPVGEVLIAWRNVVERLDVDILLL